MYKKACLHNKYDYRVCIYLVSVEDRLTSFLKESKNWERRSTNIRGVFY